MTNDQTTLVIGHWSLVIGHWDFSFGEGIMIIGVPNEIKTHEYRVAMIPVGVEELSRAGHKVVVQAGAGQGSGISDEMYAQNGAEIVKTAEAVWKRADLIVKVKEPLPLQC